MNAVVNPFGVECDRAGAKISMQWTSDVYDGLRLRTPLDAKILVAIL
ncbi:hypothetical protein H6G96_09070 [Nostoc sp. FACHB-892]|nr:hypothetical protein [Nostoc sp. FACHB-892]MBD2726478.1 hypothetical protein [Nostoc sp. FACHB-892]